MRGVEIDTPQAARPSLGRYNRAELEMLVDVLQRMQTVQEAHTERVRSMGKR